MNINPTISAELKDTAPYLVTIGNATPYHVPNATYFDDLPQQIIVAIAAKKTTYTAPSGYFEQLPQQIMAQIRQQNAPSQVVDTELAAIAPLLSTISKAPVYAVPDGYFNQPVTQIAAKAKVFSLHNTKKWLNYAAAAMVAGILVSGAFLATNKQPINYEKYSKIDVKKGLSNLSDDDLVKYLDNAQSVTTQPEITTVEAQAYTENVSEHLQNLSDEDLQQLLKETDRTKLK